jgi:copper chaperone
MADRVHIVLNVPGISCNHCKMAIEGALAGVDGVDSATVDVEAKSVDVVFDGGRVDQDGIAAAVVAEGYDVAGAHAFGD